MDKKNKPGLPAARLYKIMAAGLIISMAVLAAGFLINIIKYDNFADMEKLEENSLNPDFIYDMIKDPSFSRLPLINYAGIIMLILVPVAGLVYVLAFYIRMKNTKTALIIVAVILILALSAAIGFIR